MMILSTVRSRASGNPEPSIRGQKPGPLGPRFRGDEGRDYADLFNGEGA
jgi:hypothetical protein